MHQSRSAQHAVTRSETPNPYDHGELLNCQCRRHARGSKMGNTYRSHGNCHTARSKVEPSESRMAIDRKDQVGQRIPRAVKEHRQRE